MSVENLYYNCRLWDVICEKDAEIVDLCKRTGVGDALEDYEEPVTGPLLTEQEYELLSVVDEVYQYIARDKYGGLYLYKNLPFNNDGVWITDVLGGRKSLNHFSNLFKEVQWEDPEPWSIDALLANYEQSV